jgi:S1-C subfamily serine protease
MESIMKVEFKTGKIVRITVFFFLLFFAGNTFLLAGAKKQLWTTGITSQMLKTYWEADTVDKREGIYIQFNGNDPYLLAILKNNTLNTLLELKDDDAQYGDWYFGIYLYGPRSGGFQEGDVQVQFSPDDKTGRNYKAYWYSRSGKNSETVKVNFFEDDCSFQVTFPGFFSNRTDYYERIFPYSRDFARNIGSTGTGFLLNREGYVVTNNHVIEGYRHILVRGLNGDFEKAYAFTAALTDKENDIAILKPEISFLRLNNPSYGFTNAEMPVGSSVFALGYPLRAEMGDEIKLTTGIISSRSGYRGNPNEYQTTASISPGNSGGPLFDEQGNVIGINSAYLSAANDAYYAIKIKLVIDLIENSSPGISAPSNRTTIWGRNLVDNVAAVKNFVYMIEAY